MRDQRKLAKEEGQHQYTIYVKHDWQPVKAKKTNTYW